MGICRLIRGNVGSGKSTLAKSFNTFWLEADMYITKNNKYCWKPETVKRSHEFIRELTETIMSTGADVTISNTFTTIKEMQPYIELANEYNYNLEVIRCDNDFGNVHDVPEDVKEKMKARFQDFEGEMLYKYE